MKLIVQYIRRHIGSFCAAIFFLTVEAMADLLQPTFMSHIVDDGVKNMDVRRILSYGVIMFMIALVGAFGAVMRNLFASRTSQTIGKEMRSDMFRKVQNLSLENIDRLQPASIITRITNDVTQVQEFINGCMRIMVKAPITCIGAIVLVIVQTPQQIPVLVVILVAAFGIVAANMRLGYPLFGILQGKLDRLNNVSREFLSSIRVVKAFNAESQEQVKFETAARELAGAGTAAMRVMAVFGPLINLTVNLGIVVLLWLSQNQNSMEIGRLMASVNYMTQILFAMGMISNILNSAVRAAASSGRIQEVLEEEPAQKMDDEPITPDWKGEVTFEDVSFAYAGAGNEALSHVSFCVQPGETIGIIGSTGSGKSTLVNLVPRFYDATRGKVCIDGIDVKKMDEKELRRAIAVVPQKALLFYGTILENLRWGRKEATETEMKQAAEIACADSFIMQTENGYDTLLGQGGVNLSGGQKQRLALARALVRNPKVLILDDFTSALDAETEAAVLSGLRRHLQKVTVLLISQRISTVRRADRILCLENGTVQGIGSHEELMATCPTYQAIYHSQIGGRENG
ncbi:MAG: ABC transporter ATP-binding protein [Oliverpabstia sp.]|nr:ABC transporter ATP-binding protein/permease [Lachnospiraceae bacterium]MDY5027061.1 ABC transporter ATP-binding protein [Oliverpabstia sp.]